jgi:hypothetical protein
MANDPLFPKVTDLNLEISKDSPLLSLESFSIFINVGQIVQIKLKNDSYTEFKRETFTGIGILLAQAHNLSSLIIECILNKYVLLRIFNHMYPIIPRQLKHLQIPINSADQIKMILERCKNLSTIIFDIKPKYTEEIIQWFNDNTVNSTCTKGSKSISVWLGKKNIQLTDLKIDHKRIKLTDD